MQENKKTLRYSLLKVGIEQIRSKFQVYTTQEGTEEIKNNT